MLNYILQVILFQVLFLAIYDLFLSKETFFTKNRGYLLSTPIVSFLIPFIKIPTFKKVVPQEFIIYLPEIILSPEKVIQKTTLYQSINYMDVLFWVGVCLFFILFLMKLFKIANLIRKYQLVKKPLFTLVLIPNKTKAFSFFNYIFLGKEIPVSQQEQIIAHELVHSKQKHSLDLLFFEFLKIIMWFNPMIYFYQKRITLVHEYISDEIATKLDTKETYINNLLSNYFQVENIAFVNQFYKQSFIKKRIIMMKKTQSKKMKQLKYLLLIPVLASMLFYASCVSSDKEKQSEISLLKEENKKLIDSLKRKNEIYSSLTKYLVKNLKEKEEELVIKKLRGLANGEIKESTERVSSKDGSVSFMIIDKAPTFPGCVSGDKKCFSKMVQKHFAKNFDAEMPKTLGLEPGRKRVFIAFSIDKEGVIVDVKVRAPHSKIKEEVLRVMSSLPKVVPGEHNGENVVVKYYIPFAIVVE